MPIQQIAYDIPINIEFGILKGVYKRFGGVVRDRKTGAIVKHLKEVDVPQKGGSAIFQAVKQHPAAAIGIGVAVAVGGASTAYAMKRKKQDRANAPERVLKFEKSLKNYLKAVRNGNLDEKTIDKLMEDLNGINEAESAEKISLDLSTKELRELVNLIYAYTKKLAKANSVKLEHFKQTSPNSINNPHGYLELQKKIFEEAA